MTRNTEHRLGCRDGLRDLQNHPWFAGLDWLSLESKEIPVPFVPDVSRFSTPKSRLGRRSGYHDNRASNIRSDHGLSFMCFSSCVSKELRRSQEADIILLLFAVQEGKL